MHICPNCLAAALGAVPVIGGLLRYCYLKVKAHVYPAR